MNTKYLLGLTVIASCLLTSVSDASENKQTESDKKSQSHKSTLQVRDEPGARLPGYLKIGDIKGESSRAPKTVKPTRIEFKSAIAAPGPDNTASRSSKGYIKIGDIKGESSRAAKTVIPDRIEFKSAIAAPGPGNTASRSSKGYIKIGDIKGESSRAAKTVIPDRIEFKSAIAAPDIGDEDNDCDDAKQNTTKKQLAKCQRVNR